MGMGKRVSVSTCRHLVAPLSGSMLVIVIGADSSLPVACSAVARITICGSPSSVRSAGVEWLRPTGSDTQRSSPLFRSRATRPTSAPSGANTTSSPMTSGEADQPKPGSSPP